MAAAGSPGEGWFQGPDGGWLPPDRKPKSTAGGTSTAGSGTGTGGTTTGASGATLDPSTLVTAPTTDVSAGDQLPPSSPSPGFADAPPIAGATGTSPSGGTTAPPVSGTAGRTITVNGQTFTIPGAPEINSDTATGDAPSATAAALNYSPEDPMLGVVREQLLAMMGRANATPSINDPNIKPAADAYTAAQERARRGLQADTAESLSARGIGSSGAADAGVRQSYEAMGQNIGANNAKLLSDEQTARRGDLKSALEMANTLGMFKEKSNLERDLASLDVQTKTNLANLDAQLKTAGLTVQERLGIMEAELKKYGIDLEGNMGLLNTVLENEFKYDELKVQADMANLDATVKTKIAELDAQLRREGYSTQDRLAALDAEVRKYGIDVQGNLGVLDVALRKELGIGQLNLGLLNALLSNQQFNDGLGWDMGKWAAEQNAKTATGA